MSDIARYLNVFAGVAVIVVNQLANYLPLNGRTTGELALGFSVLFPVARYVFNIWFLIYALIIVFIVYQFRNFRAVESLTLPFLASCTFNIAWIFLWHFEFIVLSFLALVGLWASLAAAYLRMPSHPGSIAGHLSVNGFFSLYLGWVSVSTVLSGAVVLEQAGLLQWGPESIGHVVLLIALAVAYSSWVSLRQADPIFPLAFIWSLVAVAVKSWGIEQVAYTAVAAAMSLALVSVYITVRFRVESRLLAP